MRSQLAGAESIHVDDNRLFSSRYELVAREQHAGWVEWIGGRRPEMHFMGDDAEGVLRRARILPLVVEGHVHTGMESSTILYIGSAADGMIEVSGTQYFRKRRGFRDLIETLDGRSLLSDTSGRYAVVQYAAKYCDFSSPHLLELLLLHLFTRLYSRNKPLAALVAMWPPRLVAGEPLLQHASCMHLDLKHWRGGPDSL